MWHSELGCEGLARFVFIYEDSIVTVANHALHTDGNSAALYCHR
jgi:hypothetical protein